MGVWQKLVFKQFFGLGSVKPFTTETSNFTFNMYFKEIGM